MKRTRKYTDEPLGRVRIVENFLPPPENLVFKDESVKVTILLSQKSVDFFKAHAAKSKVPYQRMIRALLDTYAESHSGNSRQHSSGRKRG